MSTCAKTRSAKDYARLARFRTRSGSRINWCIIDVLPRYELLLPPPLPLTVGLEAPRGGRVEVGRLELVEHVAGLDELVVGDLHGRDHAADPRGDRHDVGLDLREVADAHLVDHLRGQCAGGAVMGFDDVLPTTGVLLYAKLFQLLSRTHTSLRHVNCLSFHP